MEGGTPRRAARGERQTRLAAAALLLCAVSSGCRAPEEGTAGYAGPTAELPTGAAGISPAGLVAAWGMEVTGQGRLPDVGPLGLHGVVRKQASAAGLHGEARVFRTVEDRVDLPEHRGFDLNGPLTIATWVRVDSLGLHQHIVACDDKWALWVTPADQYRLGDTRGGGWSTEEGRVERGQWSAVVAVLHGTRGDTLAPYTVELWVDGVPASAYAHLRTDAARERGTWGPGELYPSDACSIGFESHQGNEAHQSMPFVGAIDDLLVFSRAWSEEEIRLFSTR